MTLSRASTNNTSRRTILVVAPATLEENYTFDVTLDEHDERTFTVTVPKGGVREGQQFEIPYPSSSDDEEDDSAVSGKYHQQYQPSSPNDKETSLDCIQIQTARSSNVSCDEQNPVSLTNGGDAPIGRWRHSTFSCCHVVTQSTFWMGFFCLPVQIAQLVTRLGLDWRGREPMGSTVSPSSLTVMEASTEEASLSYNKIVLSFLAILLLGNFLIGANVIVVGLYMILLLLTTGINLRRNVRIRYKIPTRTSASCLSNHESINHCTECVEDGVCMLLCSCCSVIQMARHTHNDREYPGYACTTTGLAVGAPKVV